jgi:ribosomal protein L28
VACQIEGTEVIQGCVPSVAQELTARLWCSNVEKKDENTLQKYVTFDDV